MLNLISIVLFILILDALISASEAAIFSIPLNRARLLSEKSKVGKTLLRLKESMALPITTLIALSNLITIGGSVFVGTYATKFFESEWLGVFAAIMTLLVMIFGEIVPKRLGERYAELVSLVAAPFVLVLSLGFSPLIKLIDAITSPFTIKKQALTSEEEIAFLARIGGKEGAIEPDEAELIGRIFKLNDITAGDMMTPWPLVFSIDGERKLAEISKLIESVHHTRLPVYIGNKNNVVGIVHQRDLLRALSRGESERLVKEFIQEVLKVPDSRLGDDLLRDFKEHKSHFALVVSEYGNVVGVITIEDIIEELIGEIIEEKEVRPEFIKRISKSEILAHGHTSFSTINHFFNLEIKSRKKTLNGFLLDAFGRMPQRGESYAAFGAIFTIEDVGANSIEKVKIRKEINF